MTSPTINPGTMPGENNILFRTLDVVCVEDLPADRARLVSYLAKNASFNLIGSFDNAPDCIEFLKYHKVDLIFLDIELEGKSGLWLANEIKSLPVAIVFTTSHSQYALQAFDACALDYIVKPVFPEHLEDMLARLRLRLLKNNKFTNQEQLTELHDNYLAKDAIPTRIFLNFVGETQIVRLDEVLYFTTVDRYTYVYMANGTKYVSSKSFSTYIDIISQHPDFIRIHRSSIINKTYVKKLIRDGSANKHSVQMVNDEVLKISSLKKNDIVDQILK